MNKKIDWTAWEKELGTMSDTDMAAKIGCSVGIVTKKRNHMEIAKFGAPKWDEYKHLMGTMPDCELAKLIGCNITTLGLKRKGMGIPRYLKHPAK